MEKEDSIINTMVTEILHHVTFNPQKDNILELETICQKNISNVFPGLF